MLDLIHLDEGIAHDAQSNSMTVDNKSREKSGSWVSSGILELQINTKLILFIFEFRLTKVFQKHLKDPGLTEMSWTLRELLSFW